MPFSIRPLTEKDFDDYKAIRLEALQTDPKVFRRSYDEESELADSYWMQKLTNPNGTIFGLFDTSTLIGITAIIIEAEGHGYLTHSFLKPKYRGRNLSKLFFETRIAWARYKGLKRLEVNHREGNLASKAAILRSGFKFTSREKIVWFDGTDAAILHYQLIL